MAFWKKKQRTKQDFAVEYDSPKVKKANWRVLAGVLIIFIVLIGLLYGGFSYTSASSFCASCHEMTPELVTFEASTHNQISCVQCHIQPGFKNLVVGKIQLLKEVYIHMNRIPGTILQTSVIPNESCEQCHSRNRLVTATGDLIVNHEGHIKGNIPCITCHQGVVHAKIAERGIHDFSTYSAWTKENAEKLMNEKFIKPNMGTCIDCHEQVNQGKKPWTDESYILPKSWEDHEPNQLKNTGFKQTAEMKAGTLERDLPESKQTAMLEAMGKQQTDVKISMECTTCHQQINVPKNHELKNWIQSHGDFAVQDLAECLQCHQDSLWVKEGEKQDIVKLLTETKGKVSYKPDLITVREESRKNFFCSTCHAYMPPDHLDRNVWLFDAHRFRSRSPEERRECFVCHDNQKPAENSDAPSDVYCEFCHNKGDFPDEP